MKRFGMHNALEDASEAWRFAPVGVLEARSRIRARAREQLDQMEVENWNEELGRCS